MDDQDKWYLGGLSWKGKEAKQKPAHERKKIQAGDLNHEISGCLKMGSLCHGL